MKTRLGFFIFIVVFIGLVNGCATMEAMTQPTATVDNNAGTQPLPPYNGPKARIAIASFEVKAAKATWEIGDGLREMLITALMNTNRFRIVERQDLDAILKEQQLSASAVTSQDTRASSGQLKTADLIISAAVTEFEPEATGIGGGIGGGRTLGGLISAAFNKAHMALDIRVIDVRTSEILSSARVQGEAKDIAGSILTQYLGSWALGGGLSLYRNTPMEKAIRVCIIEAVKYIVTAIEPQYYKY